MSTTWCSAEDAASGRTTDAKERRKIGNALNVSSNLLPTAEKSIDRSAAANEQYSPRGRVK